MNRRADYTRRCDGGTAWKAALAQIRLFHVRRALATLFATETLRPAFSQEFRTQTSYFELLCDEMSFGLRYVRPFTRFSMNQSRMSVLLLILCVILSV